MIKKITLAVAVLGAGSAVYAAEAAKASDLAVTLDVTYVSDYVFRAVKITESAVQPSIEATYGDFYSGLWHSNELSDDTIGGIQDETDLYAGYKLALDDTFAADFGATRYVYNGGSQIDSTEIYVGLVANVLLSPSIYAYYDFDNECDTYIASVGYSLPVDAIKASLDFSASVGFVNNYVKGGEEYVYGTAGVAVPYKLSDTATLTVGVDYITNDDNSFGPGTVTLGGGHDTVVGKVGLSIGF
jgi:uncharacterized protein (TIGR02001 family)